MRTIGMCGTAAMALLTLGSAGIVRAEGGVRVAATVSAPERQDAPVTVRVTNSAGDTIWSRTGHRSRFKLELPDAGRYVLHFEHPHAREKEVIVEVSPFLEDTGRVAFDVVLEEDEQGRWRYARPVGRILVRNAGGRPKVEYDYRLAEAE